MRTNPAIWLLLFVRLTSFGDAMAGEPRESTIPTPSGSIVATTKTVDPVPQEIHLVADDTVSKFGDLARKATIFLRAYSPRNTEPSLEALDEAFLRWQRDETSDYTADEVVAILGAYLGAKMAADFDMEWVVVSDEYGTDYAVRAVKSEILAFPFSSVAKRVDSGQPEFMAGVYYTTKHVIDSGDYKSR